MLKISDVHVRTPKSEILTGFSLELVPGRIIGLTGRSGAGKTTLIRTVMGFLNRDCTLSRGSILLDEEELTRLCPKKRRALCGTTIGYIPQTPMTAFDPRLRIGAQMEETLRIRLGITRQDSRKLAKASLELVNLADGDRVLDSIPAQLSGGMLQRAAMALLLAMKPRYILADEPTSALDSENRNLLLQLLQERCSDAGILLISHDVEALRFLCQTVVVLDNGRVVEEGPMERLLAQPAQSWTKAFAESYSKCGREEWKWKVLP